MNGFCMAVNTLLEATGDMVEQGIGWKK